MACSLFVDYPWKLFGCLVKDVFNRGIKRTHGPTNQGKPRVEDLGLMRLTRFKSEDPRLECGACGDTALTQSKQFSVFFNVP